METPTARAWAQRQASQADREVNYEWARARVEAAKQRRDAKLRKGKMALQKRAPDAPTSTVTIKSNFPVVTITRYAPAIVVTESTLLSQTTTSTLPPVTIYKGKYTYTVTMPTPTRTKLRFVTATTTSTYTWGTTFTNYAIVTPPAVVASCRQQGGHFEN
jgi:hypothetical protein